MDARNWLWRRRSPEKSSMDTESSWTVSSHSDRSSDDHIDQQPLKTSPNCAVSNHLQSPKVTADDAESAFRETIDILTEKLSAALSSISAKEELVKQHAKVADEAVLGWEKAETELAVLRQQLEDAVQKNSKLESSIRHLDGALKQCVKQLSQAREEQEQKIQDAVVRQSMEWASDKLELEKQLVALQAQIEASNSQASPSDCYELCLMIKELEKENCILKDQLLVHCKDLEIRTLDRDLSVQSAEAASKQLLESIKKVAKLEAECLRLRAAARKFSSSSVSDEKPSVSTLCMESQSVTDSHSDKGDRLVTVDNEPSCSDSWASALIAELDQFKNEKPVSRNVDASIEIGLMDDFLEIERLVSLPQETLFNSNCKSESGLGQTNVGGNQINADVETMSRHMVELEEKVKLLETEKEELEMVLVETKIQLEESCNQLMQAEDKSIELQRQLDLVDESKQAEGNMLDAMEAKLETSESQLKAAKTEIENLCEIADLLERKFQEERVHSAELLSNAQDFEVSINSLKSQLESASLEVKILQEKVRLLEAKVDEEKAQSVQLALQVETMEATRTVLESQLESSHLDAFQLRDKVCMLEKKLEEERMLSAGYIVKLEAAELKRTELETQLGSTEVEVKELRAQVSELERKAEEERASAMEFAGYSVRLNAAEIKRKELEVQLESAAIEVIELRGQVSEFEHKMEKERASAVESALCTLPEAAVGKIKELETQLESAAFEVKELRGKVSELERKLEEERASAEEFGVRCQNLEGELLKKKQVAGMRRIASSNMELKIKQEKELAVAADKLAECQKTIASLNQQLKSLTNLDNFALETKNPDLNGYVPEIFGGTTDPHSDYPTGHSSISLHPIYSEINKSPQFYSSTSSSSSLSFSSTAFPGLAKLSHNIRNYRTES